MSLKNTKFTSISRIFSMLNRLGIPTNNESDIIEWAGDALEAIGAVTQYQETVCFVKVENFTAKVPKFCHAIIQIAKNNAYSTGLKQSLCTAADVIKTVTTTDEGPSIPVALDQYGTPIHDYELAHYRPFFDLQYEYMGWTHSSLYRSCFTPVRLTENTFFNSIVCQEQDEQMQKLYVNCTDEYNIVMGDTLKFSFQEGQVAIAFHKQSMDADGLPMIPDDISYTTAITRYITYQHFSREFYAGREGAERKMATAEQDWIWYCNQAGNKALMLQGVDEHQNFLDQRSYLIPQRNNYFGFFGNMNKRENRAGLNQSGRFR